MNETYQCCTCEISINQHGLRCKECSQFYEQETRYCETCFNNAHKTRRHTAEVFDNTALFEKQIIKSITEFETKHILTHGCIIPVLFPMKDEQSTVWKRSDFSEISYRSPDQNTLLKDSVSFICDYLRMNSSLKNLINALNLDICSTDIIISILKYSAFDVRVSIIEQLAMFQRPIPIYFGIPSDDQSSMKYYFLMHEMLHGLLPYRYHKIPFILSFGSSLCRNKTVLLNKILKTNFDCHVTTEFDSEKASNYYHYQLMQLILGHPCISVNENNTDIRHTYQYHVLDLHGPHDWNQMPKLFIQFMSVIMVHMDASEIGKIDSFSWPIITYNQTATYIIFIHGQVSDSQIDMDFRLKILNNFGPNRSNVHLLAAKTILNSERQISHLGLIDLLKQAPVPDQLLFNISEQIVKEGNINLSTSVSALVQSRTLLEEFRAQLDTLSLTDPAKDLFPLSRLKEIAEKMYPSDEDKILKEELMRQRHDRIFQTAHPVVTRLAEQSIEDQNNMNLFEQLILLWNTALWKRKVQEQERPPISICQQLEMSKERFLREFQERSREYKNLNGRDCSFNDKNLMKDALIKIYRKSFEKQQYIEIINATSATVYPDLFEGAFSSDFDLKNFYVIGIVGEQSGGKSFAMNKIFGTKTAEARFKCTTGILATRVKIIGHGKVKDIIILDTEGLLDRTKRGAEAQIFDRKMVLQVMARSHLILINITKNVNSTMQQILEVAAYGLNRLQITNRPKIIFVFRDQDPRTMDAIGQKEHVKGVIDDINEACQNYNFNVTELISGFDVHEFSSPFADFAVGERLVSFYSHNFCQQALSLRRKIIDQLEMQMSYQSFAQWISLTLQVWQRINENSNLFDFESLLHLTLETDLEAFCNEILTKANNEMRQFIFNILKNESQNRYVDDRILERIQRELADLKIAIKANLLNTELENKRNLLLRHYNLYRFPEALWESTTARIMSSLDMYEADFCMIAKREIQQDDFRRKLQKIPEDLASRIKSIQNVAENTTQFEDLFSRTSAALKADFKKMLQNDYETQAKSLQCELIRNFFQQNRIAYVGEDYFRKHIDNDALRQFVAEAIWNGHPVRGVVANTQLALLSVESSSHGSSFFSSLITRFYQRLSKLMRSRHSSSNDNRKLEEMLNILHGRFRMLRNGPYYQSNLLPILNVANDSVVEIQNAIRNNYITDQDIKNLWITSYGIMLNLFCEDHRDYTIEKLIGEFDQQIIRNKEEVRLSIMSATTAEEHGEAITKQIWTIIESEIQSHFQDQHGIFFTTWSDYRPSIIAENCVNQLFRSNHYDLMWKYIEDPLKYVRNWLRDQFNVQYQNKLNETTRNLMSHLREKKRQFLRMILLWKSTMEAANLNRTNTEPIQCLVEFLTNGVYEKDGIKLKEEAGGFSSILSKTIRTVPDNADRYHLLRAIQSTAERLQLNNDSHVVKTTEELINSETMKDRLFEEFYNKARGCGTPCPYCKQLCDVDNENHTEHRSSYHLLWVFTGYRSRDTQKPSLVCCTSDEAFVSRTVQSNTDRETYIPFADHINRFNPKWKILNMKTSLQDFQLKAYIALEEDLAHYYKFEGRADEEIRKKFLRTIVTAHCYALLIGIDYENTDNTLDGVPTFDVSCIKNQLLDSSIAYAENLYELKNDDATKDNILQNLQQIVNNLDKRSTFIFYFSGHGGRNGRASFLLTNDEEELRSTELARILRTAKTKKIILIFDSCFAGGMSNAFKWDAEMCAEEIHVLCSSRKKESSFQGETNGFFTEHLIKGLRGEYKCENNCSQCAIRVTDLHNALIQRVTSTDLTTYLTHAISGEQNFAYTSINGSQFDISFIN